MSYVNQTITPSRASADKDFFGWSIAANSNLNSVIIGAREPNVRGKAYVYSYSPALDSFTFYSILTAKNRSAGDNFAEAVAIDPQSVSHFFVGEPGKRRVLAFKNPSAGLSSESYAITASNYVASYSNLAGFGTSLGIVNNNLLIGVPAGDPSGATLSGGGVYSMFLNSALPNKFVQQQVIVPGDNAEDDQFGQGLSVYGNDLVVGAPFKTVGLNINQGQAYYYTFNSGTSAWSLSQTISNPEPGGNAYFGFTIAVKGNYLAISAPLVISKGIANNGKVYFYQKSGGLWAHVPARDLSYTDVVVNGDQYGKNLGLSVALSANPAGSEGVIVAGAPEAYNFEKPLGTVGSVVLGVPGAGPWGFSGGYIVNRNPGPYGPGGSGGPGPLSGIFTLLGRAVNAEFQGFVLASAPLPGFNNNKAGGNVKSPGAVYQIKDSFAADAYPAPSFFTLDPIVTVVNSAMTTLDLNVFVSNYVPVANFTAISLPSGITVTYNGLLQGTITALGTYSGTVRAYTASGNYADIPLTFKVVSTSVDYGPVSPLTQPISIGGTAVGSSGGSLNLLLNRSLATPNSSLGEIEDRASHPLNLTQISDPQGAGTGVCVPNQQNKNPANWYPTGPNNTYRPARMSEFRNSYRWGWANIKPFNWSSAYVTPTSCSSTKPRSKALCPGNSTMTLKAIHLSPGGDPYYWFIIPQTSANFNPIRSNWQTPIASGSWVTRGPGYDDYVFYPAGSPSQGKGSIFQYTIRLKDGVGCGIIGNIVAQLNVAYPGNTSG
jgi:hypothetical protein